MNILSIKHAPVVILEYISTLSITSKMFWAFSPKMLATKLGKSILSNITIPERITTIIPIKITKLKSPNINDQILKDLPASSQLNLALFTAQTKNKIARDMGHA